MWKFNKLMKTNNIKPKQSKIQTQKMRFNSAMGDALKISAVNNKSLPMSYIHLEDANFPSKRKVGVIIHGLFGAGQNWRTISQRLIRERVFSELFLVDLKNHGNSPHSDKISLVSMADDVKNFMKALNLPNDTSLIGHSLGGRVAMLTVLRELNGDAPKCWKEGYNGELIVVDIAPVHYRSNIPVFIDFIAAMEKLPLESIKNRKEADALLSETIPNEAVRSFLMTNLLQDDAGKWYWRVNLEGIKNSLFDIVGADLRDVVDVKVPYNGDVFFVNGEKSVYLEPSHHSIIQKLFPNYKQQSIPNAGHWVHADQPNLFISCLRDYFLHKK